MTSTASSASIALLVPPPRAPSVRRASAGLTAPRACADPLSGVLAGLRRERADLSVGQAEWRPVAGMVEPHLLELVEIPRRLDRLDCRCLHRHDSLGAEWSATSTGS